MSETVRVALHRRFFECCQAIPDLGAMGNISFDSHYDVMFQAMLIKMKAAVWAEHLGTIEVPATWWQHFKQAHFPKWLLRRFPVRMKTYDADRLYPEVSLPDKQHVAHFFVRREPEAVRWSDD